IEAALGCINLTPKDLEYNKVLRDDAHRLKVCDQSLNDPLSVPGTAEDAAKAFSANSTPTWRSMKAAELLDQGTERWTVEEIRKDEAAYRELFEAANDAAGRVNRLKNGKNDPEYKRLKAEADKTDKALDAHVNRALFGEAPKTLYGTDGYDESGSHSTSWSFVVSAASLVRAGRKTDESQRQDLAARVPEFLAEQEIEVPGAKRVEDTSSANIFDLGSRTHIDGVLTCASRVSSVLETVANSWQRRTIQQEKDFAGGADHKVEGVTGGIVHAWQSKWGKFVIGGTGPNTYEGDDFIGIIDLGGDDTYKGRVACGIGLEGQAPISFVLDLAGDDRYLGEDFTQGFGFLGVGILHDLGGGNDVYKSRFCAQGCGLCGYGELYDDGGDDTYTTDSGSQGAGCFGYGQLTDKSGNDVYRGCRYTQGFAQVMGVGVLTDGAGNDLYYAGGKYLHQPLWNDRYQSLSQGFAIGNRYGETGGGVALLLDEGDGNDVYQADIYGQGSSYWYSLGMLVDTGGNDTYTLGQYGQGGGIHLSTGILVDLKGNDTYSNPYGVGLGGAHDWAVGWLIDRAGDDLYQGNGQGQGLNFAVGVLMDCAGNDSHSTNHANSIGKGTNNDISLLLDFAGTDVYGPTDVVDGKFNRRGEHQIVYDVPEGWFPGLDESTLPTKQESVPESVTVQHILIAWDGTGVDTQKAKRTKDEAASLAQDVLKLARKKGADWKQLQTDYNEDSGVDGDGAHNEYKATPDARLVKPFKDLALSLGVGQIDICESKFGYHIIKRIE
ncbi:MAG: peptidylprolyl isomerase, partial [Planctomycetes bacterium]|nr:peptidylprolyl isomerase [Planctomycetota bacterium]